MKKKTGISRRLLAGVMLLTCAALSLQAKAAVALGATRVVYPAGQKQVQLAVTNNDEKSTFLIQSWWKIRRVRKMAVLLLRHLFFHAGKKRKYPPDYRCNK